MTYLISTLAFVMAFGAIWFTSEAAKRTELCGKAFVKPHIRAIEEAIHRTESQIRDLERRLASAERENKILRAERAFQADRSPEAEMPDSAMPAKSFRPAPAYNA